MPSKFKIANSKSQITNPKLYLICQHFEILILRDEIEDWKKAV